jgi:beta-lactamase class D
MKNLLFAIICLVSLFPSPPNPSPNIKIRKDFKPFFEEYAVQGSFLLYHLKENKYTAYNLKRCKQGFLPASTFKIPNSLISLETGALADENAMIPWDGTERWNPDWNKDFSICL